MEYITDEIVTLLIITNSVSLNFVCSFLESISSHHYLVNLYYDYHYYGSHTNIVEIFFIYEN